MGRVRSKACIRREISNRIIWLSEIKREGEARVKKKVVGARGKKKRIANLGRLISASSREEEE